MDYEKKYKEALSKARAVCGTGAYDDLTLEFIFPELTESEEDEHRRKDAIYFLESAKRHYADTSEIEKTIDWLKSLRPSWKPTDRQMEALDIVKGYHKSLTSLCEDLKILCHDTRRR